METLRIGVIGAGGNTRGRHIPLLKEIEGVEVVVICNRTQESGERAARECEVPEVMTDWRALVNRDDLDAIVIGTWPYMHAPMTIAALEAGKHVLCEARMATNLAEAQAMLETARRTGLVAQVVPSPNMLRAHPLLTQLLVKEKVIGQVREIFVRSLTPSSIDPNAPLHWRQRRDLSGLNVLDLGIVYEMLARYLGHARAVSAQTRTWTAQRHDPETGEMRPADVPETVQLTAEMESGALAVFHHSSVAAFSGSPRVEIYGSEGTLVLDIPRQKILGARLDDDDLNEIDIPPELEGGWRVERDFIDSIRDGKPVTLTSFEEGVRYMAFTEAVHLSALTGRRITL